MKQKTPSQLESTDSQTTVQKIIQKQQSDAAQEVVLFISLAFFLTMLFLPALWLGEGIIGGDLYTYFFPQKSFYASALKAGEFPLWNPLVGHGYPTIGESQTAPLYPPNLILYRCFDVNSAYNYNQLLHYAFAFLGMILYCRRIGISRWGAALAGIVFVYGWFPARLCLEWAIITGAYLPWILWCTESFLQSKITQSGKTSSEKKWLLLLSALLGLVLLAGHFNLAFIAVITSISYALLHTFSQRFRKVDSSDLNEKPNHAILSDLQPTAWITTALLLGFVLASAQLLPSLEMKQHSQRSELTGDYNPGYGHIPGWFLSQVAMPWRWYRIDDPKFDLDSQLMKPHFSTITSATNKVEAHLYFGLIPLALILLHLCMLFSKSIFKKGSPLPRDAICNSFILLILGALATLYATGWLVAWFQYVPGFSFFTGPGRYGIVTTFAAAIFAAYGLQFLQKHLKGIACLLVCLGCVFLSAADLWLVAGNVGYARTVEEAPINYIEQSQIRKILLRDKTTKPRLFANGPNMATNLGVSSTPTYLGISPAEYFDQQLTMPLSKKEQAAQKTNSKKQYPPTPERTRTIEPAQLEWLYQAGVTHVLSFQPLDETTWTAEQIWQGRDRFFNRAWGRSEPIYLYKLKDKNQKDDNTHTPLGRVVWKNNSIQNTKNATLKNATAKIVSYGANSVVIETNSLYEGELILRDLMFPGWSVTIDGTLQTPLHSKGLNRSVIVPSGKHTVQWNYAPSSFYWGISISLLGTFILLITWLLPRSSQTDKTTTKTTSLPTQH